MTGSDFIRRFTPSRTEPGLLETIFVQRQKLLADVLDRVAESATTGNMHHVLLIGPCGTGKTHFISLLHHRITQTGELASRLRIAWFPEDDTITSFVQLLKRICELLSDEYPDEFPAAWLESLLEESSERIEQSLEAELVRRLADRKLLLLVENLDCVFDGLGTAGQQKWRSFLQEHPMTCIVATSQRLFSGVQQRRQPFFGFFAPVHLKPLQTGDAVELLSHIAEHRGQSDLKQFLQTPEGRSRIRAIHHLAGGNHRIYIVLSEFITRDSLDQLTQPFEKMVDELTPHYQHRMHLLSPQQRQIVEFLCRQNAPCTPKEIARQLLAAENTVSSQLKKLLECGWVMKSPRGRESLYELTEPLMRLATEVRGRQGSPLRRLIEFLRCWYRTDPRLKASRKEIDHACGEHQWDDLAEVVQEQTWSGGATDDAPEFGRYRDELKLYEAAIAGCDKVLQTDPEDEPAGFRRAEALLALRLWTKGFENLQTALAQHPDSRNNHADGQIHLVLTRSDGENQWRTNVQRLVRIYSDCRAVTQLGSGLVRSLKKIDATRLSQNALAEWRDLWLKAAEQCPEMKIPLRIFHVGTDYLIKKDNRVFLDLIATERRILRQALGTELMSDESPTQPLPGRQNEREETASAV